jgi:hypothetical protein
MIYHIRIIDSRLARFPNTNVRENLDGVELRLLQLLNIA